MKRPNALLAMYQGGTILIGFLLIVSLIAWVCQHFPTFASRVFEAVVIIILSWFIGRIYQIIRSVK